MENQYEWKESEMRTLRDSTQSAHEALVEASALMTELKMDIAGDTSWTGDHKVTFEAWLDLLSQYHDKLANNDIGAAAVEKLDSFLSALSGYYGNSEVFGTLGNIG
jgi:hypothetical protein